MSSISISPTKPSERTYGGLDFFLLWAGAAISIAEIFTGALLAPLGLGLGLLAIVLGHVIGNTPFALGGIIGSKTGVPMMVATRPAFGVRGSYLGAALNVVQLVGWTAVMIVLGGQAANEVSRALVGFDNVLFWKISVGLITTSWALVGQRTWKWLNNVSVLLLLLLCTALTYSALGGRSVNELLAQQPAGGLPFGVGLDLAIALPISWLPLVGDYSRFARRPGAGFWGSWWGYFVGSCWMFLVGLLAALASGQPNPIPTMLALGLGVPALLVVLLSTFTTAFMDVYSTAVSSLNIAPRLGERPGIVIGGLLGTALALVFPMEQYESFLLLIGATFVPYFGVVLADYFLVHRGQYDAGALFGRGRYWYWRGFNWRALLAYAFGVLAFRWLAGDDPLGLLGAVGLAEWVQTNLTVIGASVPAMLFTAVVYLALMRSRTTD